MAYADLQSQDTSSPSNAPPQRDEAGPGNPNWSAVATTTAGVSASDAAGGAVPAAVDAAAGAAAAGGAAAAAAARPAGTCADAAEERRKQAFRFKSFSSPNFRPSTGFGLFDVNYWPLVSLLLARAKLKLNFMPAAGASALAKRLPFLRSWPQFRAHFWSPTERRDFKNRFMSRVIQRWSGRHQFRSTKPCWPFTANALVMPQLVSSNRSAHYVIDVHKLAPGSTFRGSFINDPTNTGGRWQGTGELDSGDVVEDPDKRSTDVARNERLRLERAISSNLASPVFFKRGKSDITPVEQGTLGLLATAMKAKNPSAPAIPMHITGFASAEGKRRENQKLSEDRAKAVARFLAGKGVPQPLIKRGRGPVGSPNDALNRKAELTMDTAFEGSYSSNRFSAAEHEFGHILGLPDEYQNNTTGLLGTQQTNYVNLVNRAGVGPPEVWGSRTSSVMSVGVDVLPRHYVTLWQALGSMTTPDIKQNEWSIG